MGGKQSRQPARNANIIQPVRVSLLRQQELSEVSKAVAAKPGIFSMSPSSLSKGIKFSRQEQMAGAEVVRHLRRTTALPDSFKEKCVAKIRPLIASGYGSDTIRLFELQEGNLVNDDKGDMTMSLDQLRSSSTKYERSASYCRVLVCRISNQFTIIISSASVEASLPWYSLAALFSSGAERREAERTIVTYCKHHVHKKLVAGSGEELAIAHYVNRL